MHESIHIAPILLTFGGLFLIGLMADLLGRHTPLPRVTLLILCGLLIGPEGFNWLPTFIDQWFPVLTDIALAMIGFLLGQNLTRKKLKKMGRPVIGISISVMLMTASVMFLGMVLLGISLEMALIFAGIATATAPAPVMDVVKEVNAKGRFTNTLLGVVAIDDAWGMLMFSFLLVIAVMISGNGHTLEALYYGLWEVSGALLLGIALGFPMAYLTSHLYPGKSSQAEVLGLVLLCAGLAEWMGVSYILSAMMMGSMVANFAKRHRHRPFEELETFEWPLLILFFLLAGASLSLESLMTVGWIGVGYIIFRILGRLIGAYIGSKWAACEHTKYGWMGVAMLPHAGVAIGMALVAVEQFPQLKEPILAVILGATILFELIGPVATRWTLIRVKETQTAIDRKNPLKDDIHNG